MGSTDPTAVEFDAARALIAVCRWTYAKTVPEAPHEYCLRAWLSPEHQADFDWFVALVAEHGYGGRFWRQEWLYLDVDERRYWASRTLDGSGAIINRARLEEPEPAREPKLRLEDDDGGGQAATGRGVTPSAALARGAAASACR